MINCGTERQNVFQKKKRNLMEEECPRCDSSEEYTKSVHLGNESDFHPKTEYVFFCTVCKLAWKYVDPSEADEEKDIGVQRLPPDVLCSVCNLSIMDGESLFHCQRGCDRSFHALCLSDPLSTSLVCPSCPKETATKVKKEREVKSAREVVMKISNEDPKESNNRLLKKEWPLKRQRDDAFELDTGFEVLGFENEGDPLLGSSMSIPLIKKMEPTLTDEMSTDLIKAMEIVQRKLIDNGILSEEILSVEEKDLLLQSTREKFDNLIKFILRILSNVPDKRLTKPAVTAMVVRGARAVAFPESVIQSFSARATESPLRKKKSKGNENPYYGKSSQVSLWDVDKVAEYVDDLGYSILVEAIRENEVDGSTFLSLSFEELQDDLGVEDEEVIATLLKLIAEMHASC